MQLEVVEGQTFHEQEVALSGKSFRNCRFSFCELIADEDGLPWQRMDSTIDRCILRIETNGLEKSRCRIQTGNVLGGISTFPI